MIRDMKKCLLFFATTLLLSASFTSCISVGGLYNVTLVSKNSKSIHNAYVRDIVNDTLHYVTAKSYKELKKTHPDSAAYQSIYGGDLISGVNYFKPDSASKLKEYIHSLDYDRFYQQLDTLPQDTILDLTNSVLSSRTTVLPVNLKWRGIIHRPNHEAVLSLPSGEHFVIPHDQLATFFKNHNEDIYRAYMRNQRILNTCFGLYGISIVSLVSGLTMTALDIDIDLVYAGIGTIGFSLLTSVTALGLLGATVNILDVYNEKVSSTTPAISLNAHVGADGVGLSLQF